MPCIPAPACKALLSQATARWPRRSRASDGICPSSAHTTANPDSDHELGNAGDLTHDPANGCDAHRWARLLADRRDRRVKYIISAGQIWNPLVAVRAVYAALRTEGAGVFRAALAASPGWRTYTGSNQHKTHAHVSIYAAYRNDTSPWFIDLPPPTPPTPPQPAHVTITEDDVMFIAWDPNNAWLVFRDASTGSLVRTHVGDLAEVVAAETALQGGKRLVLPKLLARIPAAS